MPNNIKSQDSNSNCDSCNNSKTKENSHLANDLPNSKIPEDQLNKNLTENQNEFDSSNASNDVASLSNDIFDSNIPTNTEDSVLPKNKNLFNNEKKIGKFFNTNLTFLSSTRYKFFLFLFGPKTNYKKISWWIGVGYELIFILLALVNIIPLVTDQSSDLQPINFEKYNYFLIFVFFADYAFRLSFADCFYKGNYKFWKAIFKYLINFFTIVDLISWLFPLLSVIFIWNNEGNNYVIMPIFILLRSITIFRVSINYSKGYKKWQIFVLVVRKNIKFLLIIFFLLIFVTFIFAILVYNVSIASKVLDEFNNERKIHNFFDAFWLSFLTITTIGYGDVFPTTSGGRIVIIFLSIFGISFYSMVTTIMVNIFTKYVAELKKYYAKIGKKFEYDEDL